METDSYIGAYEQALEWALSNDVNMVDFDADVERRGADAVLTSIWLGEYVGPWQDGDGNPV